jgi:hypothetical protein
MSMPRTRYLGLVLATLLVACHGSSSTPAAPSPPGGGTTPPPSATLSISDATGASGPYALDGLELLSLSVNIHHLQAGAHAVRLDVTDPSGVLYAQLPAQVMSSGNSGATALTLQVRGTTIESFRQVGTWQVAAWVDDAPLASASVEVTE